MGSVWTIRRSATDAKLAGVCGGVARHWGVDPVLVRVGAVLLAFSGGLGVVLYVAGWLLIPLDGRATSTLEDVRGGSANPAKRWPKEAWVAIVTVACVLTFAIFGSAMPFGFAPAVVLALIWYFGYYKNRAKKKAEHAGSPVPTPGYPPIGAAPPPSAPFHYPGPPTAFTQAAEVWRQRMEEIARQGGNGGGAPPATFNPIPPPPPPSAPSAYPLYSQAPVVTDARLADPPPYERDEQAAFLADPDPVGLYSEPGPTTVATPVSAARSRPARRLRLVALAVLGLTLAGLGIADVSGATITPVVYLGAALLVVGLTLIAATWFGRARGVLATGLVLLLALASVIVAQVPSQAGGFEQMVSYRTPAQFPSGGDSHDVGLLRVDLSQLSMTSSGNYTARIGAGRLEVIAPEAAALNVVVRYELDAGVVVENDEPVRSGTDMIGTLPPPLRQANRPTLTLSLFADVGEIRVQR